MDRNENVITKLLPLILIWQLRKRK